MFSLNNAKISVIGLGYVGLPLAIEFSKKFPVLGFDINKKRIDELNTGRDSTMEVTSIELEGATNLSYSYNEESLRDSNIYIITVPTPIDQHNQPDLRPLINASKMLSAYISENDIVIFESTVYPGATEEVCIPVIEKYAGLKYNKDFYAGYSPERINPGDKEHRLTDILKVTSGSTPEVAAFVDSLYLSIITAGTHKTSSIKVAEAAKVIENTQRDVNIALINELSIIFNKLNIDTLEVLEAAGTKWNFLPFRPGLVGGHCIGVDPYYLTHKAIAVGYHPEIILAGRRLNDGMSSYVVSRLVKKMINKRIQIENSNVLVMGLTFKENCPDLRNTKIINIIDELNQYNINVSVVDPVCSKNEADKEYGIKLVEPMEAYYDAIIIAVGHDCFKEYGEDGIRKFGKKNSVIYDLKYLLPIDAADIRL